MVTRYVNATVDAVHTRAPAHVRMAVQATGEAGGRSGRVKTAGGGVFLLIKERRVGGGMFEGASVSPGKPSFAHSLYERINILYWYVANDGRDVDMV